MTDAELDAIGAAVPAGRDYTMRRDRAIAEAVREATIEECAEHLEATLRPAFISAAAAAIRALKGKP